MPKELRRIHGGGDWHFNCVVNYTYNYAGRLASVTDANGTPYASSLTHWPSGAQYQWHLPNIYFRTDLNKRLQVTRLYSDNGVTAGYFMDKTYNYAAQNNGNVMSIVNNKDTSRSETFTYDALNRITAGWTTANTGTYSWGENYDIDAWGNLEMSPMAGKAQGGNFQCSGDGQNRATCLGYDAAGNVTANGSATYTYDQENRISSTAGMTYTYDADGNRVEKTGGGSGTLYWYGAPGILAESDLSGALKSEYVFFNGKRVARIDSPGNSVHYYLSDHLNSTSMVVSSAGTVEEESDYSPFGTEYSVTSSGANHYKFTGKERDSESGLDYFGARYNSSGMGRFMTPDPLLNSGQPWNPQSWNRYAYVENNPLRYNDPTGLYKWGNCSGTADQCKADQQRFRDSIKNAKEALKNLDPKSQEAKNLKQTLAKIGDEGKGDLKVNFGDAGKDKNGNPLLGKGIGHNLTINYDAVDKAAAAFRLSDSEKDALDAGLTAHEGTHVLGNGFRGLFQAHFEHPAYFVESATYQGLHNTDRPFGLWNESWAKLDKPKIEEKRESAIQTAIHTTAPPPQPEKRP